MYHNPVLYISSIIAHPLQFEFKRIGSWPLRMGPIGFPETSVWNCHFTLRNIAEEPDIYFETEV